MRRSLSILISTCLVAIFAVLGPSRAHAVCECAAEPLADSLAGQQVVFVGELVDVEVVEPLAVYSFTVSGIYKGDASLETKVGTLLATDDCGFGAEAQPGRWLVFASRFPDETGPLLTNRCSATALLPADQSVPAELGEARLPVELQPSEVAAPPPVVRPRIVWKGLSDWRPPVIRAAVVFAGLGLIARLLAGRRRKTVV